MYRIVKRCCLKMILIIIVICCTIVLIFNQTSLFQRRSPKFIKHVPKQAQTSITDYLGDGIHLVLVCARHPFNEMAISTIKSIMFHHRKFYNITFHIFTDSDGEKMISNYFSVTANVCTKFRIYQIDKLLDIGKKFLEKHKIVNKHYSGIYSFSKAFVHEVLPLNVHHVLLIDTDVIFVDDVYSIWKQFQLFTRNKTALGLVPWYPSLPIDYEYKGLKPDPFLTGMVLLNLNISRSIGLSRLLSEITDTAYNQFGLRSLWTADQVLLSLFATYFPKHFVALPCFVNGHTAHYLTDGTRWQSSCSGEYPRTIHVVPSSNLLKQTDYFGHLYLVFKEMPIEWLSHCAKEES
jgi:hypothetical protein